MSRFFPSLIFVLGALAAGTAAAGSPDQEGVAPSAIAVQQAQQPPSPGRDVLEKGRESSVERARAKVPLPPELKALRDEVTEQVGDLRAFVDKKIQDAGAKAVSYALWAAAGLFALMILASVLGGVVVALLFRRSRNS